MAILVRVLVLNCELESSTPYLVPRWVMGQVVLQWREEHSENASVNYVISRVVHTSSMLLRRLLPVPDGLPFSFAPLTKLNDQLWDQLRPLSQLCDQLCDQLWDQRSISTIRYADLAAVGLGSRAVDNNSVTFDELGSQTKTSMESTNGDSEAQRWDRWAVGGKNGERLEQVRCRVRRCHTWVKVPSVG